MTLTEKISIMRPKYNAMIDRKTRAARAAGKPALLLGGFRFVNFVHSLERSNRIGSRFALHLERVERAAETPVTSYVRFVLEAA